MFAILAGEQGPSCKTVEQIPNIKMIHVRFISRKDVDVIECDGDLSASLMSVGESHCRKRLTSSSSALVTPKPIEHKSAMQTGSNPSRFCPRSLSVTHMIKLGKIKKQEGTTVVDIYEFSMDGHTWSRVPTTVEYLVEKVAVGEGGFRRAYKATTKHPRFKHKTWVLKRYHPEAVKNIIDTGVGIDEHTKKAVQMHQLA